MGIDACIYMKLSDGCDEPRLERELPAGYQIIRANEWAPEGATHEVDQSERYYSEGYARGSWPNLCAALMLLLSSPDVEKVWYGGDCTETPDECTPETVLRLSTYFMEHGEREYRGPWEASK